MPLALASRPVLKERVHSADARLHGRKAHAVWAACGDPSRTIAPASRAGVGPSWPGVQPFALGGLEGRRGARASAEGVPAGRGGSRRLRGCVCALRRGAVASPSFRARIERGLARMRRHARAHRAEARPHAAPCSRAIGRRLARMQRHARALSGGGIRAFAEGARAFIGGGHSLGMKRARLAGGHGCLSARRSSLYDMRVQKHAHAGTHSSPARADAPRGGRSSGRCVYASSSTVSASSACTGASSSCVGSSSACMDASLSLRRRLLGLHERLPTIRRRLIGLHGRLPVIA